MVDLVDMAEELRAQQLQEKLNSRMQFEAESQLECENCGTEIPVQRRILGGVTRCLECQISFESKQKHFR